MIAARSSKLTIHSRESVTFSAVRGWIRENVVSSIAKTVPPGHFPEKGALPRHALRKTILESGQKLRLVFPYEGTNLFRDPFLRTNDQAIPVGFDG